MTSFLLITSVVLGMLAFFEPCTIATHTLFTVRTHREPDTVCCQHLVSVWLSRTVLASGLLMLTVVLTEPPQWGPFVPSIILALFAIVYIISRFTYVPVPHLEFCKLIPGGRKLPYAFQLGLTLPACTLPLFLVIMGIAMTVGDIGVAALAGVLFATSFTLPVAIAALQGINKDGQDFLNRAAKGSPYLTAVLLFGTALYLLVSSLEISTETMKTVLQQASWTGIGLGFLAGFVFSFNPVSFASIPVMLAYVTKAHEERRALMMGGAFVLGMWVTHAVLGVAAALGGEWVKNVMGREWGLVLGPLLIILGLIWPGWLKLRLPWITARGQKVTGLWGAFLLGIPFSVAVCPFCTPALLVTLTASAAIGSVSFGFALLLAFALGRSIPVIVGAWSMGWLESLQILSRQQKMLEIVAGVTLILTGFYLLNEYFFIIQH